MRGVLRSEPQSLAAFSSFGREAFFSQDPNSSQFLPIWLRRVIRSEPKFLAIVFIKNARCYFVVTSLRERHFRPGPKFLAIYPSLNARRFSVRTETPGGIFQCECEASFNQNRNSCRYLPSRRRVVFPARTKIPGDISQFAQEAFVSRNQNPWRYCPV